jgi:tRNA threonylcarbamoyladenosine biosynthesis protein TsaB
MKILAVDTATPTCSVAVVDGTHLLVEVTVGKAETHSLHLMSMIEQALHWSGTTMDDLDAFAVTRGPGSFTGLRIGISTVKGFCLATGRPLVGVSALDTLAQQIEVENHLICAMIDGRRNEVFRCCYRYQGSEWARLMEPAAMAPEQAVAGIEEPCIVVGNGALLYRDLIDRMGGKKIRWPQPDRHIPRAFTVAMIGLQRLEAGEMDDHLSFAPEYLRKPDIWKPS